MFLIISGLLVNVESCLLVCVVSIDIKKRLVSPIILTYLFMYQFLFFYFFFVLSTFSFVVCAPDKAQLCKRGKKNCQEIST